jgi:nucleoside phosphorylase
MDHFTSLFGQEQTQIKKVCILAPFFTRGMLKEFGIGSLCKGRPYASGNGGNFTLIHTGIGASWVGDAVLHLSGTPCRWLIFTGACALTPSTRGLEYGSLVLPDKSYNLESFSALLSMAREPGRISRANGELLAKFQSSFAGESLPVVTCASMGSVKLETEFTGYFGDNNIDVIDMETSAFFSSAEHIGRPAVALLYVTDLIGRDNPFEVRSHPSVPRILAAASESIRRILSFISTLP